MASPSFRSASSQPGDPAATSTTVTAPAGIADDDILVFLLDRAEVTSAITWPSGFAELRQTNYAGGSLAMAWKRAASESGNYTASWTGSSRSGAIMYAVSGAFTTGTPVFLSSGAAVNTGTNPDPPQVSAGPDDYLAIAFFGQEGKSTARQSATPSGYTEPANSDTGTSGGGSPASHCGIAASYRAFTGSSEDPGTATSDINDNWCADTVLIGSTQPTTYPPWPRPRTHTRTLVAR